VTTLILKGKCSRETEGHPTSQLNVDEAMLTKLDIQTLMPQYKLLNIEIDDRHLGLINEIYELGVSAGIQIAKERLEWRSNGPLWASFCDIPTS